MRRLTLSVSIPPDWRFMTIPIIKIIPPEFIGGKTYYADTDGNIRNAKGHKLKSMYCDRTHVPSSHGGDYPHFTISNRNYRIHKLVCAAFWGVPKPNQVCHHLDGNKFNNRPDNLIWLDRAEHPAYDRLVRQGIILKHTDPETKMDYELTHHCEV